MSSLPADIIIWALLVVGTVFAGIGLMGLLIFPDTRSRMFTAFRATAIGLGAVALAVITCQPRGGFRCRPGTACLPV